MRKFFLKHKRSIRNISLFIMVSVLIYLLFTKLFMYIGPFFIAWLLAYMLEPLVKLLQKFKISRSISSFLALIIGVGVIGGILTSIIMKLVQEGKGYIQLLPKYQVDIMTTFNEFRENITRVIGGINPRLIGVFQDAMNEFGIWLSKWFGSVVTTGSQTAITTVPNIIFFILVTLISTFFILKDKYLINQFIKAQIPESWETTWKHIKASLKGAFWGYIKAQLNLMGLVSIISIVGLTILRYKFAFFIGVIIGILDALPMFGSGAILIPWSIYNFIEGNVKFGVGLLIIYGIIVLMRQMLEPKLIGDRIGIHPLVTLISIYLGIKIIGVLGILMGPIFVIFIKSLQKINILPSWKTAKSVK